MDFKTGDIVIVVDVKDYPPGERPIRLNDVGTVVGFRDRTVRVEIKRTGVTRNFLPWRLKSHYVPNKKDNEFIYG